MVVGRYKNGSRTLELVRCVDHWECRISDGRTVTFPAESIAMLFIIQNMWVLDNC